jgi:hypothetical protein
MMWRKVVYVPHDAPLDIIGKLDFESTDQVIDFVWDIVIPIEVLTKDVPNLQTITSRLFIEDETHTLFLRGRL